jgi:hypothetical protein
VAGRVGERAGGLAEAVVASAAQAGELFATGLDGDGCHSRVGGGVRGGGVALAAVAHLCGQSGGADRRFVVFEARQEDLAVEAGAQSVGDLAGEQDDRKVVL